MQNINIRSGMSSKGWERFAAFNLLYEHPLTDYLAENVNDGKSLNVLLLGNLGDNSIHENQAAYNEIFKAVISCGQYPECKLAITIVSADADKLEQEFYLTEDGEASLLRDMKRFVEEKEYAYLDFQQASICGGRFVVPKIDFSQSDFGYVIIHTGIAEMDQQAAGIIKKELPNAAVWTYEEFAVVDNPVDSELYRIAANINYSYDMEFDESKNEIESKKEFKDLFDNDYSERDFVSAGKIYNADSSIACAAHIPYKLKLCEEYAKKHGIEKDPLQVLIESVNRNDDLFNKLIALEHRRWNAYMLSRGYHYPSLEEQSDICVNGVKQKSIDDMWHICLCDSSEQGTVLKALGTGEWRKRFEKENVDLSELDRASILYYQRTCELTDNIKEKILAKDFLPGPEYTEIRESIRKMLNNEGRDSVYQYEQLLRDTDIFSDSEDDKAEKKKLEELLCPLTERNRRRDFYDTDADLISMLPFCIWHGIDYDTVITVTNGNAVDDVKVAVLLCVSRVVCVIRDGIFKTKKSRDAYKKSLTNFFKKRRGLNNRDDIAKMVEFRLVSAGRTQDLADEVTAIINEKGDGQGKSRIKGVVLSCSENNPLMTSIALAQASMKTNVPLLQYDRRKGLVTHSAEEFCAAIDNKTMSIREFISLNNRTILNVGDNPFTPRQDWILEKAVENSESWNKLVQTLQVPENRSFYPFEASTVIEYGCEKQMQFTDDVLERCGVREFVDNLIKYRVVKKIKGWDKAVEGEGRQITLTFFDSNVFEGLNEYTVGNYNPEAFPRTEVIMKYNQKENMNVLEFGRRNLGTDKLEFNGKEKIDEQKKILEDLFDAGLIEYRDNDGKISFTFEDRKIRDFCLKEGNAYELLVYFRMRNTGLFKHVGLGIHQSLDSYINFMDEIKAEIDHEKCYGLKRLQEISKEVSQRTELTEQHMDAREIDVVAMYKMTPVFVSCKAKKKFSEGDVNEINTVANQFGGIGILCVKEAPKSYKLHDTAVSVIDLDKVKDEKKFKEEVERALAVLDGKKFVG